MPITTTKEGRRLQGAAPSIDAKKFLHSIVDLGGSAEDFYDWANAIGARLGLQYIRAVFNGEKPLSNFSLLALYGYALTLSERHKTALQTTLQTVLSQ